MEKILTIDGRQVRFKSTAALPLRYKAQLGRDLIADFSAVQNSWHPKPAEDGTRRLVGGVGRCYECSRAKNV